MNERTAGRLLCAISCGFAVWFSFAISAAAQQVAKAATPQHSKLGMYYAGIDAKLRKRGYLRTDRNPDDAHVGASDLHRNFVKVALEREYGGRSGLMRWEKPVRMQVRFGPSVPATQRKSDLSTIKATTNRLQRATGHPISMKGSPNFLVLVVSHAELGGLSGFLRANVPGISDATVRKISRMPHNYLCMVVTVPSRDQSMGIESAVALVRAEHTPAMRRSCIEEELAQGMGLPNDWGGSHPSIFNDNEEFGVLTRYDELLLRLLYSPQLRSGMPREQAEAISWSLAQQML